MQEKINQLQNELCLRLIGIVDIYKLDSYTHDCLIIGIIDTINTTISNLNLTSSNFVSKFSKDYILILSKNPIPIFGGKLSILIEFKDSDITNLEVATINIA